MEIAQSCKEREKKMGGDQKGGRRREAGMESVLVK